MGQLGARTARDPQPVVLVSALATKASGEMSKESARAGHIPRQDEAGLGAGREAGLLALALFTRRRSKACSSSSSCQ